MRCDLTDSDALAAAVQSARPDRVVHLAGVASVVHTDRESFHQINVGGTENLLRACARLPSPPKVALASSSNVYGIHSGIISEEIIPAPVSDYGRSKLAMEAVAATWARHLPILIARPFNYTGPGQSEKFLVAKIAAHFRRRASIITLGNTQILRDFSDVADVVDDYLSLMDRDFEAFEAVNFCTGSAVSVASILQAFIEMTGHHPEVRQDEALLRNHDIPVLVGDPSKLVRLSGRAHHRPFATTLAKMLEAHVSS